MDISKIIGQGFGFVAVILGFVSFQVKTNKRLLVLQIFTSLVFSIHYLLLGAISAGVLNMMGIIRNIVYYHKDKKFYSGKIFPVGFAIIMVVLGICSWEGLHSVLAILGIGINTLGLSLKNPQNIRKSILVSSPMVLIYDVLETSIGGIIYETIVIISSIIGIFRYRNTNTELQQETGI